MFWDMTFSNQTHVINRFPPFLHEKDAVSELWQRGKIMIDKNIDSDLLRYLGSYYVQYIVEINIFTRLLIFNLQYIYQLSTTWYKRRGRGLRPFPGCFSLLRQILFAFNRCPMAYSKRWHFSCLLFMTSLKVKWRYHDVGYLGAPIVDCTISSESQKKGELMGNHTKNDTL